MTNQKVYVVIAGLEYSGGDAEGVFARKEDAESLAQSLIDTRNKTMLDWARVQEFEVQGAPVEPKAGILENKLSQDQMQALFTGAGAPGREHHDPTCIKFFGVFSPLPCPCKRPAERTT